MWRRRPGSLYAWSGPLSLVLQVWVLTSMCWESVTAPNRVRLGLDVHKHRWLELVVAALRFYSACKLFFIEAHHKLQQWCGTKLPPLKSLCLCSRYPLPHTGQPPSLARRGSNSEEGVGGERQYGRVVRGWGQTRPL